jgi:hypothetical protein
LWSLAVSGTICCRMLPRGGVTRLPGDASVAPAYNRGDI